jgi:DMSO/TMAO reductase YedYZ molybdopterin-dependent catalytic subunit
VTRRQALLLPAAGLVRVPGLAASEPRNLSYPLRAIEGALTTPNFFFLRDHFEEPELSLEDWKLKIEGHVDHPYELGFSDLVELPTKKLEAVLECAGNTAGGSAVSNGLWEGVPISALLLQAGVRSVARFAMLEGADQGRLFPNSPALPYSQLVPIEKCLEPTSLAAFRLNDLFLPRGNGFPARAVFPGWYAMNSVKWLQRIVILKAEDEASTFSQSGMNRIYNRTVRKDGSLETSRLTSIQVKSAIAWPTDDLKLPAGRHLVWGFAWTGLGLVRTVLLSVDGGKTWAAAKFDNNPGQYRWVRWSYLWSADQGQYTLMSRAFDDRGQEQPIHRDPTRKDSYELNSCPPVHCSVL